MMLDRWRSNPISFIETVLHDPETKKPFKLLPAEHAFLEHAFKRDGDESFVLSGTGLQLPQEKRKDHVRGNSCVDDAAAVRWLLSGSDDLRQRSRAERRSCLHDDQAHHREQPPAEARGEDHARPITFPAFDATITAIPSNFATAAGGNQNISVFDELWAFTSERSRRLWDELVPPPTRQIACRLTTTYAGYEGESLLLQDLYRRGLQQPRIGDDLYAGDGILMFWSHSPVAPWQDERWLAEMRRTLRANAYQRLVLNEFASAKSQFVDMSAWDQCVQPALTPTLERIPIYVGVDASTKRDSTALVAVTFDKKAPVQHRVFTPAPGDPINFEATVEATIIDWRRRFVLRQVLFDPFQMAAVSQRLAKAHVPIEEYPQSVPNLTAATQNLFDLIQSRSLVLYPDAPMRLAASRAVIVESSRGWRLDKLKQAHKIDVVVALSMACLAAVRGQGKPGYDLFAPGLFDD